MLCDGLKQLIGREPDLTCAGVADNTCEAKRLVEKCKPDLMLLDLRLKSGDALDLIKSLRVEHPDLKVLVLSQYDELIFAERALRAGASGYIMKENATDEVLRAVRKVLTGELYFSEKVAAAVVQRTLREKPSVSGLGLERLSDRELQVFQLLGASYSARDIAEQFCLSRKTIETHCEKIKHKLSLHNAAVPRYPYQLPLTFCRMRGFFTMCAFLSLHSRNRTKKPLLTLETAAFARRFCSEAFSLPRIG